MGIVSFLPKPVAFAVAATAATATDCAEAQPPHEAEGRGSADKVMTGDEAALRILYERHARAIQRFLRDAIGESAAAADATQETFARAFRSLHRLRESDRVAPWLFGIARNVALEHRKARRRAAARFTPADGSTDARDEMTPERALMGCQTQRVLARALARMGEGRRTALLLRADHQLPYDEIATVMGWSLAKVKVEIFRARQLVRAELETHEGDAT
jgi:RNA polymerase sigma-70 factor, ECF subfamily